MSLTMESLCSLSPDPLDGSLTQLSSCLARGELSAVELCQAALERLRSHACLNAVLAVLEEEGLSQARAADLRRRAGKATPLSGIPLALKDNICQRDAPMTCGSRVLAGYTSPYSATVVTRLEDAGAVLLARTNLDEFAMGSSTEHSAYGPCLNPWDPARTPGGSSGGSAAAVAAGLCAGALGSDTGGSVRQPAALCGLVGLKPTWGRVSRYGLVAFGSSLDQIGPLGRQVEDVALLLQAIAGGDPNDATCAADAVPDFRGQLEDGVRGLRIGVPRGFDEAGLHPEVRSAVDAALATYQALGARRVPVDLPHAAYGIASYYLVATAEASSNLARFDGIRYGSRRGGADLEDLYLQTRTAGFGDEVKRRIMLGTFALSSGYYDAYYGRALEVRARIREDHRRAFEQADVLLTPTTPTPAFRLGEKAEPLAMYLADIYTVSANLAGLPALSLPCGFSAEGLPIGLHLLAPAFQEARLLQVARAYERETDWHRRRPRPPAGARDGRQA